MNVKNYSNCIATAIIVSLCVSAYFYVDNSYRSLKAEQAAADQYENSSAYDRTIEFIFKNCGKTDQRMQLDCVLSASEDLRRDRYGFRDLQAQEDMAFWAFWMFLVAAISTAVGLYGIYLLRETWLQTRRAADITETVGYKQTRANLVYSGYTLKYAPTGPGPSYPGVDVMVLLHFHNSGATPARDICFDINILSHDAGPGLTLPPPKVGGFDLTKVKGQNRRICGANAKVNSHSLWLNLGAIQSNIRTNHIEYIVGNVRYMDDFFGDVSGYRYVRFCLFVQFPFGAPVIPASRIERGHMVIAEHGPENYAD